ncbi:MAG: hypothetical protein U1F43_24610 [Myxococcota bacterium]
MIKVDRHLIVCDCPHCLTMFPPDRFEATWVYPAPTPESRRVTGRLPIGHARARPAAVLWVDGDGRLETDWPGMPGTRGARVEVTWDAPGGPTVTATRDPALAALAEPVPLTRKAIERMNARCMVEYALAPADSADFVACARHGASGVRALACEHVIGSAVPIEAIVMYDPDGDYPDCLCVECYERYRGGDASVVHVVCSRCQQTNLVRHRLVGQGVYGG